MAELYILGMANAKRDRNGYKKQLGLYRLSRANILAIEQILWEYADAREMKIAGVSKLPEGRSHMPRKAVDRYASVGRYSPFHITFGWKEFGIYFAGVKWIYCEDSVKFLARHRHLKRTHYLELAAWPGIKVTFTPLSTTIYAQTHYATGKELRVMKETIQSVENYLDHLSLSSMNTCVLSVK